MLKIFLKNSLIYTVGHTLTSGIAIFLLPIYTRYLSPTEYGVIDMFMVIAAMINLTIALEITQGIARYYQEGKNEKEKREYTSSAFWFTLLVYLLFISLSIFYSDTFTFWLFEDVDKKKIFLLAVFAIATNGIFHFKQKQLRWQIQPKKSVLTGLINVVVAASLTVYLMVALDFKIESIFVGQIAGNIVASLFAIICVRKSYGFIFCITKFKKMVSYSMPLVLSGIGVYIALYIDRIAIKDLLGLDKLGIYGVGYRFAGVAFLVMAGFQQSLSPLVFKYYKEKKTPSDISKIFNIFVVFSLTVVAGAILFSKELVILFTTEAYYSSADVIAILVMAVFFSNMYIFTPGISIAKKTKIIFLISIIAAIINTILNYTLIPLFGIGGAAFATLISSIITFSLYAFFSLRYYSISYNVKTTLLSFIIMLVSSYGIIIIFNEIQLITIIIKSVFLLLVFTSTSFLLLEKKDLKKIMLKLKLNDKIKY